MVRNDPILGSVSNYEEIWAQSGSADVDLYENMSRNNTMLIDGIGKQSRCLWSWL